MFSCVLLHCPSITVISLLNFCHIYVACCYSTSIQIKVAHTNLVRLAKILSTRHLCQLLCTQQVIFNKLGQISVGTSFTYPICRREINTNKGYWDWRHSHIVDFAEIPLIRTLLPPSNVAPVYSKHVGSFVSTDSRMTENLGESN